MLAVRKLLAQSTVTNEARGKRVANHREPSNSNPLFMAQATRWEAQDRCILFRKTEETDVLRRSLEA